MWGTTFNRTRNPPSGARGRFASGDSIRPTNRRAMIGQTHRGEGIDAPRFGSVDGQPIGCGSSVGGHPSLHWRRRGSKVSRHDEMRLSEAG